MFFTPAASHYVVPTTLIDVIKHLGITTNLRACYDAGDITSWSGSGELWLDTSGNGLDATNGTSTGDTTFNHVFSGVAGEQSSNEYWIRQSGGSLFRIPRQSWMEAVHKTNGAFTCISWRYSTSTEQATTFDTTDVSGIVGGTDYPGFYTSTAGGGGGTVAGASAFAVYRDDGTIAGTGSGSVVIPSGWTFLGLSWDEAAGVYNIHTDDVEDTGALSYSSPSSNNGSRDMAIYRTNPGDYYLNCAAMWDRGLSAAELRSIYNATKAKFGH